MKHEAARYVSGFDYFSAARNAPSWYCRNSAAKLAASWARLTELAASMAVQAILGAFLAALVRHDHARKTFSLYFVATLLWPNPQAAVLLQGFSLLSASNA